MHSLQNVIRGSKIQCHCHQLHFSPILLLIRLYYIIAGSGELFSRLENRFDHSSDRSTLRNLSFRRKRSIFSSPQPKFSSKFIFTPKFVFKTPTLIFKMSENPSKVDCVPKFFGFWLMYRSKSKIIPLSIEIMWPKCA